MVGGGYHSLASKEKVREQVRIALKDREELKKVTQMFHGANDTNQKVTMATNGNQWEKW